MGVVRFALKFRNSFFVLAVLMLLAGAGSIVVAPKDVLPAVDIPVVVVVWTYNGLDTTDIVQRITNYSEFSLSSNVNNIKRIDSTSIQGTVTERIYFDPSVSIDLAITQVDSAMNAARSRMPPGVQPPVIMRFSASSVPVIQLALSSTKDTLTKVFDYAQYRTRQRLAEVPGSTLPSPYGGAPRQVMVDLDLAALRAVGMTPLDVTNAVLKQNLAVPSGLAKIGEQQYAIRLNASPELVDQLNRIPVKVVDGQPVLLRDVAHVRDGAPPQLNIVRADGHHSVLLQILKNGSASTLEVVNNVKKSLADIRAAAPAGMSITPLFDQSVFVSDAIQDVVREAVIAAGLTGLTILLFLGSWRSTLVVLITIPLAILTSLSVMTAMGETINIMTLGGLALSVGILVDHATVAIENTYRMFEEGQPFRKSVVMGVSGIAKPALISTLAICAAFVAVFFLTDAPKYLFTPQAEAVVFAMLASYVLSLTLVPILIDVFVAREYELHHAGAHAAETVEVDKPRSILSRVFRAVLAVIAFPFRPIGRAASRFCTAFECGFTHFHTGYVGLLRVVIAHRVATLACVAGVFVLAGTLLPFVGQDYFPQIESSQMTLHVRTRPGMRIETTEKVFARVEDVVRETVPKSELGLILDNIGLPASNYNFAFMDASFVAYNDGQTLINLKGEHKPISFYEKVLRKELRKDFPDVVFYFQPSDIITQILNFGTIAQIDVQVIGRHDEKDLATAQDLVRRISKVRGAVDVHLHQIVDAPQFYVNVDRKLASEMGLSEQDIAQNLNISLSGSFQVSPNFWADPKSGTPYQLWVQTPEYRNASMTSLMNTPLAVRDADHGDAGIPILLSSVASMERKPEQTVVSHVNTQPTYDVLASVQNSDLGSVRNAIEQIVEQEQAGLQAPDKIRIRGQIESMESAFFHLEIGLGIALVAVYLLLVLNYQTWGDPFVVLAALPVAFCGIVMSLFITGTTFSIPALFGAIMSVGVASANSILLVTFAKEHREATGCTAIEAALMAGQTRLRPVLMTAAAMFLGLIPMAIGSGEGSEQNAALARAVLGGIAMGTCSTLIFVPFLYALLRRGAVKPLKDYA
ncbi:efflux RND transporter permease subunit [Methylobacterium gnaphalii]|uniref:RND transporter n=1 Tax=Methylobacterium gnaphalii TaxID=1010610 RepID=A0A512JQ38_9HYPH|nr:efflux RND transporter permease subunit [Methylobacterium gnaphalii]GEP12076.1 RND transporter [Methylobacterium gnaphalii]GJD70725.1 Cobalt-zinc-cadmium resistance protein CzcA [Methylobacterium gnaphalii]GLS48667.1 RND transporter [Methylobacterium gnaphalii]